MSFCKVDYMTTSSDNHAQQQEIDVLDDNLEHSQIDVWKQNSSKLWDL